MRYLSSRLTCLSHLSVNFTVNLITKALQNNSVFLVILQICLVLSITPPNSRCFCSFQQPQQNWCSPIINSAFVFSLTAGSDGLCKGVTCWGEEEAGRAARLREMGRFAVMQNMLYVLPEHGFPKIMPLVV